MDVIYESSLQIDLLYRLVNSSEKNGKTFVINYRSLVKWKESEKYFAVEDVMKDFCVFGRVRTGNQNFFYDFYSED